MGASAPATRRAGRTHESRTWFFRRIRTHTVRTERSGDDAPIPWVLAGVEAPGEADVTAHPFKPFRDETFSFKAHIDSSKITRESEDPGRMSEASAVEIWPGEW